MKINTMLQPSTRDHDQEFHPKHLMKINTMLQPSTRDHDQIDNRCEGVCISCQLVESITVGELSPPSLTPSS
jgi:hypothetical protein